MSNLPVIPQGADLRAVVDRLNRLLAGKLNATTTVTLTAGATTTTLTDARISSESYISFMPTTATAAAAVIFLYVSARTSGSATLTHNNTADVDRSFSVLIIG